MTVCAYVDIGFFASIYFHDTYVFIARNSYTKSFHATVSSSESSHRRAIKGLAEYCDAQKTVESKERLRLPEMRKFWGKHFLYYSFPTSWSTLYQRLHRCFEFFRWIYPRNLRWSRISRLKSRLWGITRRILSSERRRSRLNMAKLWYWLYKNPQTFVKVFLPKRYWSLFTGDDCIRSTWNRFH